MNSKEALELLYRNCPMVIIRETDEIKLYSEYLVELIKQDLDRLEKFAHENASLHTEIESLQSENEIWKKAIENSNKAYDVLMQNSNIQFLNQNQEIFKLKKVIEILKDYLMIKVSINRNNEYCLDACDYAIPHLNKEQYDLLKEYL